jgi:pyruvate dehydrogenase E1 component beta subunit
LIVVAPTTPYDAKGLLNMSIADENPVIFVENKRIVNKKGAVPEENYTIPFGEAEVIREGKDITLVATQALVYDALELADELEEEGISIEIIDPRTLKPLDYDTIFTSVEKTNRLVVADEGWLYCGIASEIAATVAQERITFLDAPIVRVGAPDCPCPFSPPLEDAYIPGKEEIRTAIKKVI